MIFTITPLVQEAKTKRQWLRTFGIFTAALVVVLGAFGAAMAWAGDGVGARVMTTWAVTAVATLRLVQVSGRRAGVGEGDDAVGARGHCVDRVDGRRGARARGRAR